MWRQPKPFMVFSVVAFALFMGCASSQSIGRHDQELRIRVKFQAAPNQKPGQIEFVRVALVQTKVSMAPDGHHPIKKDTILGCFLAGPDEVIKVNKHDWAGKNPAVEYNICITVFTSQSQYEACYTVEQNSVSGPYLPKGEVPIGPGGDVNLLMILSSMSPLIVGLKSHEEVELRNLDILTKEAQDPKGTFAPMTAGEKKKVAAWAIARLESLKRHFKEQAEYRELVEYWTDLGKRIER